MKASTESRAQQGIQMQFIPFRYSAVVDPQCDSTVSITSSYVADREENKEMIKTQHKARIKAFTAPSFSNVWICCFSILYHCKLNILQLWTVYWTK